MSFEDLSSAPPEIFWEEVRTQLVNGFRTVAPGFELPALGSVWDLGKLAAQVKDVLGRRWVLIIDEFDGVPEHVLSDLMHRFRRLYHQKSDHALHSLALVGVRNITNEKPPLESGDGFLGALYQPYSRYWYVRVRKTF